MRHPRERRAGAGSRRHPVRSAPARAVGPCPAPGRTGCCRAAACRRDGRQAWGPGPSPRRRPTRRATRRPAGRARRSAGPGPPALRRAPWGRAWGPREQPERPLLPASRRRVLPPRRRAPQPRRASPSREPAPPSASRPPCLGRLRSGEESLAVLLLEPHLDGKLDRRGGRLDELAHLLQLLENFLALDAVGLGEFVNSGLSHVSPSGLETRVPAGSGAAEGSRPLWVVQTHRKVLIECS